MKNFAFAALNDFDSELSAKLQLLCQYLPSIESSGSPIVRKIPLSRKNTFTSSSPLTSVESYDADTEDLVHLKNKTAKFRRAKRSKSKKTSNSSCAAAVVEESSFDKTIYAMRDVLIRIQNDRTVAQALKSAVSSVTGAYKKSKFLSYLEDLQQSSVETVMMPYTVYIQVQSIRHCCLVGAVQEYLNFPLQEVESLCSSIALRQKFTKQVNRLKTNLSEIESERQENLIEKVEEREALQASADAIR